MWRRQTEVKPSSTPEAHPEPLQSGEQEPAFAYAGRAGSQRDSSGTTCLTRGIAVKGEITGNENLYVDGEVQGKIQLSVAAITIGPNGRVSADIEAREIEIHGQVQGTLRVGERVHICRTGVVTGDIVTERIAIDEGAVFQGRVDMARPAEARASTAAAGASD